MNYLKRNRKLKSGMTLLETAMVLGIVAISMAGLSTMLAENARTTRVKAAAEQIVEISGAARNYIAANDAALRAAAGPGRPIVIEVGKTNPTARIPPASLQGQGFLSQEFVNRNSMDQNHFLLVKEPSSNAALEALVITCGGNPFADTDLGRMSGMVGSGGGGVYQNNPVARSTEIYGSFGGWRTPVRDWRNGRCSPSGGRPAVLLQFANAGGDLTNYLSRYDNGVDEEFTMRTKIIMNAHDLNNVPTGQTANDIENANVVSSRRIYVSATDMTNSANRNHAALKDGGIAAESDIVSTTGEIYSLVGRTAGADDKLVSLDALGLTSTGDVSLRTDSGNADSEVQVSNDLEVMGDSRLCEGNATDCRVEVSDDGYFVDRNRGWVELFTNLGLKMTGGGRLEVGGRANFYQDLTLRHARAVLTASTSGDIGSNPTSSPEYHLIGIRPSRGSDSRAIYIAPRNSYNTPGNLAQRVYFGGLQGGNHNNSARIELQNGALYSSIFYDLNDNAYFVDPNANSNLNTLTLANSPSPTTDIAQMLPNYTLKGVQYVTDGARVNKPTCSSGQSKVILVPARAGWHLNNPSHHVPTAYFNYSATNAGSRWNINLDTGRGNPWYSRNVPLTAGALAMAYCYWPGGTY